jgi:hypothetical protein
MIFSDGGMDTLKSSSRNKSVLTSQPEKEDPEPISTPKEASPAPARTLNPVIEVVQPVSCPQILVVPAPQTPVPAPKTPVPAPRKLEPDEPERKVDEKEKAKEGSKLTRKLKQLYKGEIFKSLVSCYILLHDILATIDFLVFTLN